jgi:CYTH domain-containing protein
MAREIEHKYLVKNALWRQGVKGTPYRRGYSIDPERSVRVRAGGGEAFLTVRGKSEAPARDEFEYPIPVADAWHMLEIAGNLKWEIAEVEIDGEGQQIVKPGWVGEDVTADPRYFNINRVRHSYSEWAQRDN